MAYIPFLNNAYFSAKVGIGTDSPGVKLDVAGSFGGDAVSIRAYNSVANFGDSLLVAQSDNANTFIHAGVKIQSSGSPFYIYQSGGAAADVLRFNYNSLADTGGQMVLTSAGNVGIGTASPGAKLDVNGNATLNYTGGASASNYISMVGSRASFGYDGSIGSAFMRSSDTSKPLVFGSGTNEFMRIVSSTGNVGIGTTSPSQKLEVIGRTKITQSGDALRINSSDANGSYATWQNNGSNIGYIGAGYHLWSSPNNIATSLGIRAQTRLDLGIQASVHMTILNSGNVGIGTASPGSKLEIAGANSTTNAAALFSIQKNEEGYGLFSGLYGSGASWLQSGTADGTTDYSIVMQPNGGNVGIGTTSPRTKLEIGASGSLGSVTNKVISATFDGGYSLLNSLQYNVNAFIGTTFGTTDIFAQTSGEVLKNFYTGLIAPNSYFNNARYSVVQGGAERLTVVQGGNVGIGTTTPAQKLDVNGNVNILGSLFVEAANNNIRLLDTNDATVNFSVGVNGLFQIRDVAAATTPFSIQKGALGNSMIIKADGEIKLGEYGAGTLVSDASGNITVSSGGGAGGPYLPLAGGTLTGALVGTTADFAGLGEFGEMITIDITDISTGENRGLKLLNSSGTDQQWNITAGQTNVDNDKFTIRDATNNVDALTIGVNSGVATFAGAIAVQGSGDSYFTNKVGIGTTSPAYKLDVNSSAFVGARIESTAGGYAPASILLESGHADSRGQGIYQYNSVSKNSWFSGVPYSTTSDDWVIAHKLETTAFNSDVAQMGNALFCVNDNGKVGIGTTNPSEKLHVFGGSAAIEIDSTTNEAALKYDNSTTTATIKLANNDLKTELGGSEVMRILANGNVGIGTTSPGVKLDVSGQIRSNDSFLLQSGTTAIGSIRNQGGALDIRGDSTRDVSLGSVTSPQALFVEGTNGNVGIGTTSPSCKLTVGDLTTSVDSSGGVLAIRQKGDTSSDGITLTSSSANSTRVFKDANGHFNVSNTGGGNIVLENGTGNVGIGTTSPDSKLDVTGGDITVNTSSTGFMNFKYGSVGSEATMGSIQTTGIDLKINATSDLLLLPGSNVGIGTTSPSTKLEVAGTITSTGNLTAYNANPSINIGHDGSSAYIAAGMNASGGNSPIVFSIGNNNVAAKIVANGNVGIGTTSPITKLHLYDNTATVGLSIQADNASNSDINLGDEDDINIGRIQYSHSTDSMQFQTNNAERMRITNAGNVGIGTTSPSEKLQVNNGKLYITESANASTANLIYLENSGSGGNEGVSIKFNPVYGAESMIASNREGAASDDTNLTFHTALADVTTEKMRITSDGNVGIGTTSPSSKLQVAGGVQMADDTDTASADKVGTQRYRVSGNNSYVDMCMQTGAATYAWINIVQNNW